MKDETRESIKVSIRCVTDGYVREFEPREAYRYCVAFVKGIQYGSQDAELCNFTNRLLEEYRIKLICEG